MSRKASRNSNQGMRSLRTIRPPMLSSNVAYNHTYRFTSTSGTSGVPLTAASLAGATGGVVTVVNSTLVPMAGSIKINYIEIWGSQQTSTTGTPATVSCEWISSAGSTSNREVVDVSTSAAYVPYIRARPPRNSLASFWQEVSSGVTFCNVHVPVGGIIDVHVSVIQSDESADSTGLTITTGALGHIYYLALDGPATNYYLPVALTTTS